MNAATRKNRRVSSFGLVAAAALGMAASPALANPTITADFAAGFSAADEAVINTALAFYETNISNTFSLTIDFGTQAAGTGASSIKAVYSSISYASYYNDLVASAASSGNTVQASAVASLGTPVNGKNPVTNTTHVALTATLANVLGLVASYSQAWTQCDGLTGAACIDIGTDYLSSGDGGTPAAGLLGVVEHEFDEVLGTSSNLPNGGGTVPSNPSAADLFRYSAAGVRSYSTNDGSSATCPNGTPAAYLSVDGGTTNLDNYNNCNNGADYGDWAYNPSSAPQVQDAYGSPSDSPSLTLASPEVALLSAIGYDFANPPTSAPEPASIGLMAVGLAALRRVRRKRAA